MSSESKTKKIQSACESQDLEALTRLATSSGGLLDDEFRKTAWPILLGSSVHELLDACPWRSLPEHPDEGQVKLDVDRAFVYYPSNESEKLLGDRRTQLFELIVSTLRHHPNLSYFQGYHDIVQVLLLVLGAAKAPDPVARLSLLKIRDFMLPTLAATTTHLDLLPAILQVADAELEKHLSHTRPFFALSATLTLYAHDIEAYGDISRLFDFLLASDAVMSIYLFAIIIISRKERLLDIDADEPEMLHSVLSKLPKPLNLEHLISLTVELYHQYPPETLPNGIWRRVPRYSVLKTTRDHKSLAAQTLEDGEMLLRRQIAQLNRLQQFDEVKKRLWKMRKPAGTVGLAVLVAFISYWLRREGLPALATLLWKHVTLIWNR